MKKPVALPLAECSGGDLLRHIVECFGHRGESWAVRHLSRKLATLVSHRLFDEIYHVLTLSLGYLEWGSWSLRLWLDQGYQDEGHTVIPSDTLSVP
jgi:hypothetical protein